MNTNNQKKKLFWSILIILLFLILTISIEGIAYLFYKLGKLRPVDKKDLAAIVNSTPKETFEQKPIYIPHPYFGSVYTPNNHFVQGTPVSYYMESNSEGFVDNEFPSEKREGICIYGLLGGSAAMSWGVHKREDRISYQLETLLNTSAMNDKCKEYRVLNMAIGGHIQYQATQIYLYYQSLLDGVIFYNGNNEGSHATILTTELPVQFSKTDFNSLIKIDSPLKYEISALRQELSITANFLLMNPYLLNSYFVEFLYGVYFKNKLQKIDKINRKLMQSSYKSPQIKGKEFQELRQLFLKVDPAGYWFFFSIIPNFSEAVIRKVIPIVYTQPLINAFAVANVRHIKFLSIIQPMSGAMSRKPGWGEAHYPNPVPVFQKVVNQILIEESKKLETYGIKTYNLNNINLFDQAREDIFTDGTHLTAEGNRIVANYLFKLIKEKWLYTDKNL